MMRLTDLDPRWVGLKSVAPQARGIQIGLTFECPCCIGTERATRLGVMFDPPIDPEGLLAQTAWVAHTPWHRAGDDFTNISLSPSIDASNHGHWHGHITNGEIAGGT